MLQKFKGKEKTLVFVETKHNADFLAILLSDNTSYSVSVFLFRHLSAIENTTIRQFC